jgi:hypothetical protein
MNPPVNSNMGNKWKAQGQAELSYQDYHQRVAEPDA